MDRAAFPADIVRAEIDPAQITVVTSPGCHFCHDAQDLLDKVGREYPLTVTTVPANSSAGAALLGRHRARMFPLILLDGSVLACGKLPEDWLRTRLAARAQHAGGKA